MNEIVAMNEIDEQPGYALTIVEEEGLEPREVEFCPGCGRARERWEGGGRGYDAGVEGRWCCGGCYAETGCTCGD